MKENLFTFLQPTNDQFIKGVFGNTVFYMRYIVANVYYSYSANNKILVGYWT